jgi:hypothetical protein
MSFKDLLGLSVLERFNHGSIVTHSVNIGKRKPLFMDSLIPLGFYQILP